MRLILIRHAESEANLNPDLICGRSPSTPLSQRGHIQAEKVAEHLFCLYASSSLFSETEKKVKIYCSSAVRAKVTAQICLNRSQALLLLEQNKCEGEEKVSSKNFKVPEVL